MIKLLFTLFVSCLVVSCPRDSKSEPAQGRDFYALQSKYWNVEATKRYTDGITALGSLHNTFGNSPNPVHTVLDAYHPNFYRVHIINTVCVRNKNCGTYELGYGYDKQSFDAAVSRKNPKILKPFTAQVSLYCELFRSYPATQLIISPALEHDLSQKSWRILADATLSTCPTAKLSNSPDGGIGAERYRGALIERHGNSPQPDADIVSLDGVDATGIDIDAFLSRVRHLPHVQIVFLWIGLDNCRVGTWVDPRARTNCPSGKTLELVAHLFDSYPPAPAFTGSSCKRISPFKDPDIWKPLAESQVNYDPRQELPVLITKRFKPKLSIDVVASNGSRVGRLGYYGTYLKAGYRWYAGYADGSKSSGYALSQGAKANSGSSDVWLQQGSNCSGPLLPGKRQGLMRDK